MKKLDYLKSIQLGVFIVITLVCAIIIISRRELFHTIATDPGVKLMCGMLWLTLGASFFFIYMDFIQFSRFKQDYHELDYVAQTDRVAGIANRFSSDALIDKYLDKALPENLGCIMFAISNLGDINQSRSHTAGNQAIKEFSTMLKISSVGICFVARNGGNRFLALFEECDKETMNLFLERISQKVAANNSDPDSIPLQYSYGMAYSSDEPEIDEITRLIALSDRRITM